jgi:hypothetical protein
MTTITNPRIGARIFTHKGNSGIVEQLEDERVIIRIPDGILKSIPLTAIARWELPAIPKTPVPGQRVRLKGTDRTYILIEIYEVYYGRGSDDQPFYEQWARLKTPDGKPATWKISQLELLP